MTYMPIEYDETAQDALLVKAFLGEIDWTPVHPISLPSLRDRRLQRIGKSVLKRPANSSTLDQWAAKLKMSPSSFARRVRKETELTFQRWRDQIRTVVAIPLPAEGRLLVEIAEELGYETAWAFTAMFKRVLGKPPSLYNVVDLIAAD
jgi:AraC-like DNA-binding protein